MIIISWHKSIKPKPNLHKKTVLRFDTSYTFLKKNRLKNNHFLIPHKSYCNYIINKVLLETCSINGHQNFHNLATKWKHQFVENLPSQLHVIK